MGEPRQRDAGRGIHKARWYHYVALVTVSAGLALGAVFATSALPFPLAIAIVVGVVILVRGLLWFIVRSRRA